MEDPEFHIPTIAQKLGSGVGQGASVSPEVWDFLVPVGRPPKPAFIARGARTPDDLWSGYGHRINAEVLTYCKREYDHWHLVESCFWVDWYCVQYPEVTEKIDGRNVTTRFDMLVCYRDGHLELREIKSPEELREPQAPRIKHQLAAQKSWAETAGIPYLLLTDTDIYQNRLYLENWKKIHRRMSKKAICLLLQARILALLTDYPDGLPLSEIISAMGPEEQSTWINVFALLHSGLLWAPLGTEKLSRSIWVWRIYDEST